MGKNGRLVKIILITVGVLFLIFVVASFVLINHFLKVYFNRSEPQKYVREMRWADYEDFERETVTFPPEMRR